MKTKTIFALVISFLLINEVFAQLGKDIYVPRMPILDMSENIFDFLSNPKPGLYRLPGSVERIKGPFCLYNSLYVGNTGKIILCPDPNEYPDIKVESCPAYVATPPSSKIFCGADKEHLSLKQIYGLMGCDNKFFTSLANPQWLNFFTINRNFEINLGYLFLTPVPHVKYIYVTDHTRLQNGLFITSEISVGDGYVDCIPEGVYGTLSQIAQMTSKEQLDRKQLPFKCPNTISSGVSLEAFLHSSPKPGLYALPGQVVELLPCRCQGIYICESGEMLLCPALVPWNDKPFFYMDQCYAYLSKLPTSKDIEYFKASVGRPVTPADFCKFLGVDMSCLQTSGDFGCNEQNGKAVAVPVFTVKQNVVECSRVFLKLSDMSVKSVSLTNSFDDNIAFTVDFSQ